MCEDYLTLLVAETWKDTHHHPGRGNHSVTWLEGLVTKQPFCDSVSRWRAIMVEEKKGRCGGLNPVELVPRIAIREHHPAVSREH